MAQDAGDGGSFSVLPEDGVSVICLLPGLMTTEEADVEDKRSGRCLCGAVRIETRGPLRGVIFCHCGQCRRQTGLFYAATNVPDDQLEVAGGDNITWFAASDEAKRGFCRVCGSALFWKRDGSAKTSVLAGIFDQPSGLKGEAHIFVADKGDFYAMPEDGLPCFQGSDG